MTFADALIAYAAFAALLTNAAFWGAALVGRLFPPPPPPPLDDDAPPVTLIRPFRGREEGAVEKNASLLRQDYPRLEVLFVAEDEDDPGMAAAEEACALVPGRGRTLVSRGVDVSSGKVRNMVTGWRASDAPLVGFCDSDVHLDDGDLRACVRALLSDERVGASWMPVVCREPGLHGGMWLLITAVDGVTAQLALPRLGLRQTLQGGLMVLRRDALERAGGVEQLGDTFADDVRAGNVVQDAGYALRSSERLLLHASRREPVTRWLPRFHRWTVCIRSEAPLAFFGQLLLNPVALPLVAWLCAPDDGRGSLAAALLAGSVLSRLLGTVFVDYALLRPRGVRIGAAALLRPFADLLFFTLSIVALVLPFVRWRERWYRIGLWSGRIVEDLGS